MKFNLIKVLCLSVLMVSIGCTDKSTKESKTVIEEKGKTAKEILGNPDYLAMSFGGYRDVDHSVEPAIDELKEDLRILAAMDIKVLRTYKVHLPQATNLLQAIHELKQEDTIGANQGSRLTERFGEPDGEVVRLHKLAGNGRQFLFSFQVLSAFCFRLSKMAYGIIKFRCAFIYLQFQCGMGLL